MTIFLQARSWDIFCGKKVLTASPGFNIVMGEISVLSTGVLPVYVPDSEKYVVAEQDAEVLVFSSDGDFDDFTAAGKSLDRPYYVFTTSANRPGVFFDVDSLAAEAVRLLRGRLYGSDIPGCRRVASWKFIETAEETVSSADVG